MSKDLNENIIFPILSNQNHLKSSHQNIVIQGNCQRCNERRLMLSRAINDSYKDGSLDSTSLDHIKVKKVNKLNGSQKWVLINLALVNLITNMSYSIIAPFYPHEASSKGISGVMSSIVFAISAFAVFIFSPIFGKFISSVGTKFMFIAGLFTVGISILSFGLLEYIEDKIAFITLCLIIRFIGGLGSAALLTSDFILTIQYFPGHSQIMFAVIEMCCGIGMALGPAVGGFIYSSSSFGVPFYVIGTAVILLIPVSVYVLPSNDPDVNRMHPSSPCKVIKNSDALLLIIVIVTSSLTWAFLDPVLQPHLSKQYHLSVRTVSVIFLAFSTVYGIFSPLFGWILQSRKLSYTIMCTGLFGSAISFLLLGPSPFTTFIPSKLWITLLSLFLLGISASMCTIPTFECLIIATRKAGFPDDLNTYGLVAGAWNSAYSLGEVIGPTLAGILTDNLGFPLSSSIICLINLALMLIILGFCLFKKWKKRIILLDDVNTDLDESTPFLR